jgi:hypothetical protein
MGRFKAGEEKATSETKTDDFKVEMLKGSYENLCHIYTSKPDLWAARLIYASIRSEGVRIRAGVKGGFETYEYSIEDVQKIVKEKILTKESGQALNEGMSRRDEADVKAVN